jgi:HPt (histidine-containing phosphotransfer) domain-containing protein
MTANVRREDEQACLDAGMDGFIAKPVRSEALRDALLRAATREGAAAAPVDPRVFGRLRALEGDAPGVLREIVDLYLSDTPARVESMRAAAARRDADTLAAIAHGLKGSSGYIGAREIELLCGEIIRHVHSGRAEAAFARIPALDAAVARAKDALTSASEQPAPSA